jgi:hypothetical protein
MEKSESGWHVAECRANANVEDAARNMKIVDVVQKCYEDDGMNALFPLFSKSLLDMVRRRDAFRLYYSSPRASKKCIGTVDSLCAEPCDKPSQTTEEGEPLLKLDVATLKPLGIC